MNASPSATAGSAGDQTPSATVYASYLPVPVFNSSTLSPSTSGRPSWLLNKPPLAKTGDATDLPAGICSVVLCQGVKPASKTPKAPPLLLNIAPSPGARVMPG